MWRLAAASIWVAFTTGCNQDKAKSGDNPPQKEESPCPPGTQRAHELGPDLEQWFCKKPDGTRHGPYRDTDAFGGSTTGGYIDGNKDGTWRIREDSELSMSVHYSARCGDECELGPRITYQDGKPILQQSIRNGQHHGWSLAYDKDGSISVAACYDNGIAVLRMEDVSVVPEQACPLRVQLDAPVTGRVLAPVTGSGQSSLVFKVGEIIESGAETSRFRTDSGEEVVADNAFLVALPPAGKLKRGTLVLGFNEVELGIIGSVIKAQKGQVTIFRHIGFGTGLVRAPIEVPALNVRVVSSELQPGSAILALHETPKRIGTVLARHGDKVAAMFGETLVVLGEGAYQAIPIAQNLAKGTSVYVAPFIRAELGEVVSSNPRAGSITVEYTFMDSKRQAVFSASRVMPTAAVE